MSDNLPGKGVFGWLGRQVGYVKKAVKTKPTRPPAKRGAEPSAPRSTSPPAEKQPPAAEPPVVYRHDQVQEAEHPTEPGLKLRRTIIDEVIVDEEKPRP